MEDKLYIILNQEKHGRLKGDLWLGYLPFNEVPEDSILWTELRAGEICFTENSGFKGIYLKKKNAVAHAKIERKWRNIEGRNHKIIIVEIKNIEGENPFLSTLSLGLNN